MAKWSTYAKLLAAALAADDYLPLIDASAGVNKAALMKELRTALLAGGATYNEDLTFGPSSDSPDYDVLSLNGLLGDATAAGLEFDRTGGDPDLYIISAGGAFIAIGTAFDLGSLTRGLILTTKTQAERDALAPAAGEHLLLFNSDTSKLNFWDGAAWRIVTST